MEDRIRTTCHNNLGIKAQLSPNKKEVWKISPQDAVQGLSQNFNQEAQKAGVDMNNMNQVIGMMNPKRNAA
jgi:hypothetical protein